MPKGRNLEKRIEELRQDIRHHNHLYHVRNEPEISDREFDALMEELIRLEREHPDLVTPDSPTQKVGGQPLEAFTTAPHLSPMLSIDNTYNEEEVRDFDTRVSKALGADAKWAYVVEPKIDGVAINLIYRNGSLQRAITRGDGVAGDDVTQNARTVRNLTLALHGPGGRADPSLDGSVIEVRGEVYMSLKTFGEVNRERERDGDPLFANPRNATAGSLKLLDPRLVARRRLLCFTYEIGSYEGPDIPDSHWKRLGWLQDHGCPTNPRAQQCKDVGEVLERIAHWEKDIRKLDYPVDGLVVKVDSAELRRRLGSTSKSPRWMMAYKFAAEQQVSKVLSIDVYVGKSGALTPVAVFEPVHLSGTMVKHASLHNFDELERKDVRVGDHILVEKAGEIIPQVVKVVTEKRTGHEREFPRPKHCPFCDGPVRYEESDSKKCLAQGCEDSGKLDKRGWLPIERDSCEMCGGPVELPRPKSASKVCRRRSCGAYGKPARRAFLPEEEDICRKCGGPVTVPFALYCDDPACPAQRLERIVHFAGRGAMDIEGMGEALVRQLVDKGLCKDVADIYSLDKETVKSLARMGDKSAQNLMDGVEASKTRDLSRLLYGLGIPHVGGHLSEVLARSFGGLDGLRKASVEELRETEEVGPIVAQAIADFLRRDTTKAVLDRLIRAGVNTRSSAPKRAVKENPDVAGKTFVLTGTLERHSRDEARKLIESQGGRMTDSVSRRTDYLVVGGEAGSKLDKAQSLGVKELSETEMEKLLGVKQGQAEHEHE